MTRQDEGPNAGTKLEELRTIGTDGFEDETLTENALRKEWNAAHPDQRVPTTRTGHGGSDFAPEEPAQAPATAQTPESPQPADPSASSSTDATDRPNRSNKGLKDILERHLGGQK